MRFSRRSPTVTRLWVCLTVVPGKFDVSALRPATLLNRVLLPQLGCPMRIRTGSSGVILRLDLDALGDPAPHRQAGPGGQVVHQERAPKRAMALEDDPVTDVEAQGEQPLPDPSAALDGHNPDSRVGLDFGKTLRCRHIRSG